MVVSQARRLLDAVDRWRVAAMARRASDADRTLVPVRHASRWQPGAVAAQRPVAEVVREILDEVVAACRAAGADPQVLPARNPLRTRVAVPVEQREPVVTALCARAHRAGLLARDGRDRRPLERIPAARLTDRDEISVFCTLTAASGHGAFVGEEHGCDLEFHRPDPEVAGARALRPGNQITERVPEELAQPAEVEVLGRRYPTWTPFAAPRPLERVDFPIDVVYTWVDGADEAWRRRKDRYLAEAGRGNEQAANASRYEDREELRYSLRSLHLNAEWVNHVWLVTDRQVPAWLDASHPSITVVDHRDIFADPEVLPTFNSHAIESQLHHIEGLTEHFLYMNDDVYLGRWTRPETFFLPNGMPRFFPSRHQLDPGPATDADPPVMAAGKTGRDLLHARFGRLVTQKLKHVPHALRRSTLDEIEREFPTELRRTMGSRFRSPDDVSLASAFAHHYGFLTGRAVPGDLRYRYLDLVEPALLQWLERMRRERPFEMFCINDTIGTDEQLRRRGRVVVEFLEDYFCCPSPLER